MLAIAEADSTVYSMSGFGPDILYSMSGFWARYTVQCLVSGPDILYSISGFWARYTVQYFWFLGQIYVNKNIHHCIRSSPDRLGFSAYGVYIKLFLGWCRVEHIFYSMRILCNTVKIKI